MKCAVQGLAALQPKVESWLGRLGGAAAALVVRPADSEAGQALSRRRWDVQDKIGIKAALPGLEDPVLWLDTLLPLVCLPAPHACSTAAISQNVPLDTSDFIAEEQLGSAINRIASCAVSWK